MYIIREGRDVLWGRCTLRDDFVPSGTFILAGMFSARICDLITLAGSEKASGMFWATHWKFRIRHTFLSHCAVQGSRWDIVGIIHVNSRLSSLGWDWWFIIKKLLFFSVSNTVVISLETLMNFRNLYCFCKSVLEAWKFEKISPGDQSLSNFSYKT